MKTRFFGKSALMVALAVLWLASDRSALLSSAGAQPAPPAPTDADASAVPPATVNPPPNIPPNSPLAQVIRLAQAGVDQSVITSYVSNSSSTFNLNSDTIIYLSDLGVPNEVVTTMMQHDQMLQQTAAANPPPTQPETPATEPTEPPPPSEPAEVTVNYFYSSLSPYGTWVDVPGYGRCWRPTIVVYNSGWQPYCDRGHWVYTDCGWYWTSDYSWGVTFHYGRWFRDARMGWCWWPDTAWGPSWVTWRYSNDYCGWAPLPPFAVFRPGVGFVYRGNGVSIGFNFGLAPNCFTFVPTRNFCDPHPRHFRVGDRDETRIFNQTTVINNFNFNSHNRTFVNNGIAVQHISEVTRTQIHPVPVRDLRVSGREPWRGGPIGRQNHGPGITTGNAPHPGSVHDNRNNPTLNPGNAEQNQATHPANNPNPQPNQTGFSHPGNNLNPQPNQTGFSHPVNNPNPQPNHVGPAPGQTPVGAPAQNHFQQPANNPTLQPNGNSPDHSQTQIRNNENNHLVSPRRQQFEQQMPHYSTPNYSAPKFEQNNNAIKPEQHQIGAPAVNSSVPVARPQPHVESHPNVSSPPSGAVTPTPPPPASSSSQSSQSSQTQNSSGRQGQNNQRGWRH